MARANRKAITRHKAKGQSVIKNAGAAVATEGRSVTVAKQGIKTGADFANFMSGLMSDVIEGKVPPQVGNAACNAGGKLLKIVELQYKYGRRTEGDEPDDMLNRPLLLTTSAN